MTPGGGVPVRVCVLAHGKGLPLPSKATPGSSGVDLRAAVAGTVTIPPGGRALIPTGIRVEIPSGWEWQVRPRSGLAASSGITVLNAPGTVDSDYRGEVRVILVNLGESEATISRGDRIAQAVLCPVGEPDIIEAGELPGSDRGDGGFGHSGLF